MLDPASNKTKDVIYINIFHWMLSLLFSEWDSGMSSFPMNFTYWFPKCSFGGRSRVYFFKGRNRAPARESYGFQGQLEHWWTLRIGYVTLPLRFLRGTCASPGSFLFLKSIGTGFTEIQKAREKRRGTCGTLFFSWRAGLCLGNGKGPAAPLFSTGLSVAQKVGDFPALMAPCSPL